jgi:hypothetical protein
MPSFTRHFRPAAPTVTRPRPPSPGLRHRRSATVGLIATLLVLAGAIPAQATVIDKQHYEFFDSFPDDVVCGVAVRHDIAGSGVALVRVGKGGVASAFFGIDNYRVTETLTNEANGNFVQIERDGVVNFTKATHVSGSIFKFTVINAGQPFTIRDMSGRVVARDRGVIREIFLFDTLGDDTPGGLYLEELGLLVSGPHPLFTSDEDAFCAIVRPLLLG